jgi:3-oxoacyl-[acyl-carrier-protein] synthase II
MERRRVVVTGVGAITPVGNDVSSFWSSLTEGRSGIGLITQFDASETKTKIAGEVKGFDPETYFEKREARRLDRYVQLFIGAAQQAMDDSGIDLDETPELRERMGAVAGAGMGGLHSFEESLDTLRNRGPGRLSPLTIPKLIANMSAGMAAIRWEFFGPTSCTVTACAASANAIGDAAEMIRRGAADVMLAGGAEATVSEFVIGSFNSAKALSTNNDDPEGASRPFDLNRDGFVLGEGGAVLMLEERDRALARGVVIYGEIAGYGMSTDGFHITLPRPGGTGQALAIKAALGDARLDPSEVQYLNAHGTSTGANDKTETAAIKLAYGDAANDLAVSSTKSMTGHLLGGAGAVEALACLLAIRDQVAPPTINLETPDPECDLDYIPNTAREMPITHTQSNSFGFGGHNVSLIISKHES